MQSLSDIFQNKDIAKELLKHPRHKMIDEMTRLINRDRQDTTYKPIEKRVVAIKTSLLTMDDMGYLLKRMQQASYPGKVFFGSLKVK